MEDRQSCLSSFLRDLLQRPLLCGHEPAHVALEKKRIGEESERSLPLERVAHERSAAARFKLVDVPQPLEPAANHLVDEDARAIERGDSRREALPDSEVLPFERDQISTLEQA